MITIIAAALAFSSPQATQWPIGMEREVDEGVYMKVIAAQDGWRIWRSESINGARCKAVKSAAGRANPIPVGVANMMFRGTPFLEIAYFTGSGPSASPFSYSWVTTHYGDIRVKYRLAGARFYEERSNAEFTAKDLAEVPYDVVVSSWEYPAINRGNAEETAVFDFKGRGWAEAQVRECQTAADGATS